MWRRLRPWHSFRLPRLDSHYYHGGVANALAYQLEISAFGYAPADFGIKRIYPWLGFRVGVIGNLSWIVRQPHIASLRSLKLK